MARKGLHTSVDKDDSEDSDEVDEQEESVTGTKTPINPVPVAMKTPSIATYKIIKQGEKEEDELERVFWKYLKGMFEEPLSTDPIWSEVGQQKIISWRYYESCRVHCLNLELMVSLTHPGSMRIALKLYDVMYKIVNGADTKDCLRDMLLQRYKETLELFADQEQHEEFLFTTSSESLNAKTTAWNEFSSTMASVIICLATNQKFNFSKYIFESMVKNLNNVGKFLMYPRKQRPRKPKKKDIEIPQPSGPTTNVTDEAVYKERDAHLVRAATTATSLDAEQDSGGGPRRQETIGDIIAQTGFENVSKTSNNSLLAGVNTPRSDDDRLKLNELIEFCTKLQQRALDLENIKTAQAREITSLKLRVKKLEKKRGSRTHKLKILYKVGRSTRLISSDEASLGDQEDASKQGWKIDDIDKDAEITLVQQTQGRYSDEEMFDIGVLDGDEVLAESEVTVKDVNLSVDEVTLAQALAALKSAKVQEKANIVEEPIESITTTPTLTTTTATTVTTARTRPKAKGLVIHEEEQATTPTVSSQQPSKEKGKRIMVEEPVKMKKKDQINLDEELALKLQAELEEEDRLVRQREEEANIVS
ncbi:hypothetical protein Tco_0626315 [Tanacetum coccineum]|uniref:Synaptobrevin, longin-like domain protein n=1 Tax=Tanacetum coccineum TaxID=301880 RepID=A0ABQ4WJA2_9ASTR